MADVTGDDGLLLWWSHTKGVAYHCFLDWVHLQGETHANVSPASYFLYVTIESIKDEDGESL